MKDNFVFSKGSFFHETKAELKIGDFLIMGQKKNYNDNRKSEYVYFSGTLDAAIWGAELAEVTKWEGHSPALINSMLENLRGLSEKGIKAID